MKIGNLIEAMNYNLSRNSRGKSDLGNIEKMLVDLFFQRPKTDEQIKSFEANLFSNPDIFDKSINYGTVKGVDLYFRQQLNDYKKVNTNQESVNIRQF